MMKKSIEKTLVILLITMLMASSTLVLQTHAQAGQETEAFLNATPNPVQVGTPLAITGWITPPPRVESFYTGLTLTITHPDGATETIGPLDTDSEGYIHVIYVPDMVGGWEVQLHFPEQSSGDVHYLPSDSSVLVVTVLEEVPEYVLEITVNPPEGGTVTKDPDMETYPLGTEVTLEATANEGYTFVGWSGDLSGTDNQQTLIIDEDPQVTATFSLDYIPPSEEPVTVYPHPNVTLTFDQVLTGGEVHVTTSYDGPPGYPLEGIGPYYYIEANPLTFTTVSVGIHYDDTGLTTEQEEALTLWRFDPAVPAVGDVNGNGRVDFIDLFLITLSLGTRPGQWRWNPACDINGDLRVNLVDLFIAILNFGKTSTPATWTNITDHVDIVNNVVYGETDHFSPYRVH
jgi:uncharacterized repeat protein (TIGR02543 family)